MTYSIIQISTGYRDVENIEPLTKNDLLEFFLQYIHPFSSTRAKLSVHLIAQTFTGASAAIEDNAATEKNSGAAASPAEQDVIAVNRRVPSVYSARTPIKIEDVKAWKASLQLSAAATPVKSLSEFEELGSR